MSLLDNIRDTAALHEIKLLRQEIRLLRGELDRISRNQSVTLTTDVGITWHQQISQPTVTAAQVMAGEKHLWTKNTSGVGWVLSVFMLKGSGVVQPVEIGRARAS